MNDDLIEYIFDYVRDIIWENHKYDPITELTRLRETVWRKLQFRKSKEDNKIEFKNSKGVNNTLTIPRFLVRQLKLSSEIEVEEDSPINALLNSADIEDLAAEVYKYLWPVLDITICKGEEITENFRNEVGGHSCMTGECCDYTLLYEMNPERFSQLIIRLGKDSARAMILHLNGNKTLLDRVYATSNKLKDYARDYAREKGWAYRENDHADCRGVIGIEPVKCIITGLEYENGNVPYTDTLHAYNVKNGKLNIFHPNSNREKLGHLSSQEGWIDLDGCVCYECGDHVRHPRTFGNRDYCEECFYDMTVSCYECDLRIMTEDALEYNDNDYCEECYNAICEEV